MVSAIIRTGCGLKDSNNFYYCRYNQNVAMYDNFV